MTSVRSRCRKNAARLPALLRIQRAASFAYGATRAYCSSAPSAATARHSAASLGPTSGTCSTQPGGAGTLALSSAFSRPATSPACSTMVSTASASGTITTSSITVVITIAARPRFPHKRPCTASSSGHVETTTSVDQISAGRNGRRIHRLAMIMIAMNSTASMMRGSSRKLGMWFTAGIGVQELSQELRTGIIQFLTLHSST